LFRTLNGQIKLFGQSTIDIFPFNVSIQGEDISTWLQIT
jgi:hypothetical protein